MEDTPKNFWICSNQFVISPTVIKVEKDQSIKKALDKKILLKSVQSIQKIIDQMPNICSIIQTLSQILPNETAYFTTVT